MIAKLNLVTILAAIVLFFFPWLEVQCSARPVLTQSGIQTIYGGASPAKELKELAGNDSETEKRKEKDSISAAVLPAIAFLAILAAAVFAFLSFLGDSRSSRPGIYCAIAFGAIVIQSLIEFPVRKDLADELNRRPSGETSPQDPFARMGDEMARAVLSQIHVRYLPAFYLELIALGIPSLIFANDLLDRLKKRASPAGS